MPQRKNRYPGIRSFEADDQILFNGRSKEIDELFNLVKIKPLVVLFGKSGLGKTSLLKAGVGPLLLKQHYFPILIRLQDTGLSPSATVLNILEKYTDKALFEKFGNKTSNKIWETLKASTFTINGKRATPVLIFDQFEELFNHPKIVQEEFSAFIGDLTEQRMPYEIEEALSRIPRNERSKELLDWFQPPDVKIVFAIRSDRMSELHKMRFEIPAILQNRYELKPLHAQQAKDAIVKPAALAGDEFLTNPFSFSPETIEKIQAELTNEFGEIESFQLQIVCQYIERNVYKLQTEGKQNVEVTPDFLGGEEGIKGILKNYYTTQISLLGTNEDQQAARLLLEEGLIVNKRRIGIAEAVVKESFNISDELLEKLLTSRLLRPEDTRLGRTYEISHDTLVEPILDALQKRKIGEARMEEIRERIRYQKKRKRALIFGVVNFLIAVASVIGLVYVINYYEEAERAKDTAERLQKVAEVARDSLLLLKDTLVMQQTALLHQREELEKTKADLEQALNNSGAKARQELEKIQTGRRKTLINELYSKDESRRVAARRTLTENYKDDPAMISEILEVSKDKVNQENQNSIYQVIYLLEQSSPGALKKNNNETKIENFNTQVRAAGLAGPATEARLKRIEGKLD